MPQSCHFLLLLALAAVALPARAEIYRYYDADGGLVLSDKVPKERAEQVERLQLREPMTVPALREVDHPVRKSAVTPTGYMIVIQSPAAGVTYPKDSGPIPVAVSASPSLAKTHRLEFVLDGRPSSSLEAIQSVGMEPGSHTLVVRVIDADSNVLKADTVSFLLQ